MYNTSNQDYIKATVSDIEIKFKKEGKMINANALIPMSSNYKPELNSTMRLGGTDTNY